MSTLKVNGIRSVSGSSDAISIDAATGVTAINGAAIGGLKNVIVNGAMLVHQYGSTSQVTNNMVCDRFRVIFAGEDEDPVFSKVDLSSSDTGPWAKGFRHALEVKNGNQSSGAQGADKCEIQYKTEAMDIANSGWDYTSASSYITLSFWIKSSVAQNFYGHLTSDDGTAQNYPFETGSLSANTWTKITKVIPGNTNLQFNNDTGQGLAIRWGAFYGTDVTATPSLNTWAAHSASAVTPANTSTWWTTNDATFQLTGVQLEVGIAATEFEHRRYPDYLRSCQRYYYKIEGNSDEVIFGYGRTNGTTLVDATIPLPAPLRASPTITCADNSAWSTANSTSSTTPTVRLWKANRSDISLIFSGHSGLTNARACTIASQGGSNLELSAEI